MKTTKSKKGLGLIGVIQVVFIILKLTKLISWPWWRVFSPILGYMALIAVFLIIYALLELFD